jgi:hypothetical protein
MKKVLAAAGLGAALIVGPIAVASLAKPHVDELLAAQEQLNLAIRRLRKDFARGKEQS